MQEAHSRQAQNDQRRRPVLRRRQDGGDARLVVVLQEVGAGRDRPGAHSQQVPLHARRVAATPARRRASCRKCSRSPATAIAPQAPSKLPRATGIPGGRAGPPQSPMPRTPRWGTADWRWEIFPRPGKHFVEHEHRHVATHAVASPRDGHQQLRHRRPRRGVPVVQLGGVSPRREIGVLPVRQPARSPAGFHRERSGHLALALHEQVRPLLDPPMVQPQMVGHKVQQQLQPPRVKLQPERGQTRLPAQRRGHLVIANRVGRPRHVRVPPARQGLVIRPAQLRMPQSLRPGVRARSSTPPSARCA